MRLRLEIVAGLGLLAALPSLALSQSAPKPDAQRPNAVLELFTSQGCSSCPAADALLRRYAERPAVIALSLPVDYWDHLGWKDTLASPKHALRQKGYAKALGTGNVYTPQVVVNGAAQAVGSNEAEIEKAIYRATKDGGLRRVSVEAKADGDKLKIEIGPSGAGGAAETSGTVWLAVIEPRVDVEIKRGENRGRTLSYVNVVRELTPVGMWSGQPLKLELPSNAVLEAGRRYALIVQASDGGRIVGAAWMAP